METAVFGTYAPGAPGRVWTGAEIDAAYEAQKQAERERSRQRTRVGI
jgi:hypothetical protein